MHRTTPFLWKKRLWALVLAAAIVCPGTAFADRYPRQLDPHEAGQASSEKPLFMDVIQGGVNDPRYEKIAQYLYRMPSGRVFQYDPSNGTFLQTEDVVAVENGDYTYYYQNGRLIRMVYRIYDQNRNLIGRIDYRDFQYDADGRLVGYNTYRYGADDKLTGHDKYSSIYDENGRITKYQYTSYDQNGSILSSYSVEYKYNAEGRIDSYHMTWTGSGYTYTYDYTNYKYDADGRVTSMDGRFDYNGLVYTYKYAYEYDFAGRNVKSTVIYTDPNGGVSTTVTTNTYNVTTGKLVVTQQVTTDAQNGVTTSTYNYDADQRLSDYKITAKDASGAMTYETTGIYQWDSAGNLTQYSSNTSYANGSSYDTTYRYENNQITDYTSTSRDASGGITSVTKAVYARDGQGNVTKYTQDTTYSSGSIYNYTVNYDQGKVTDYSSKYTDVSGATSISKGVYSYDASGNISKMTYDSTYSGGGTSKAVYNYQNNQITDYTSDYTDSSGATTTTNGAYARDASGNLTQYTQSTDYSNGSTYDAVYNYQSNRITDYRSEYKDSSGTTVTSGAYTYDGSTLKKYEQSSVYPNGSKSDYTTSYNANGTLEKSATVNKDASGTVTSQYEYSGYTYDTQNRVLGYTYKQTSSGTSSSIQYDSFTYNASGSLTFYKWRTYDAAGNLTGQGQWP